MKRILIESLQADANLTLADGFPLFDYSKIPVRRYEYSDDDGNTGLLWNLEGIIFSLVAGFGKAEMVVDIVYYRKILAKAI